MKIQIRIWNYCLKKSVKWLILLLLIIACYLFSLSISRKNITSDINFYLTLIGYYNPQYTSFFSTINLIYQYVFSIYFTHICYTYEVTNSFNNVVLRINGHKWIIDKLLVILSSNLLFRIIISILLYLFFINKTTFPFLETIDVILSHLLTTLIIISLHNFVKNKKIQLILIMLIVPIIVIYTSSPIKVVSIILLLVINYKIFNIKQLTE